MTSPQLRGEPPTVGEAPLISLSRASRGSLFALLIPVSSEPRQTRRDTAPPVASVVPSPSVLADIVASVVVGRVRLPAAPRAAVSAVVHGLVVLAAVAGHIPEGPEGRVINTCLHGAEPLIPPPMGA